MLRIGCRCSALNRVATMRALRAVVIFAIGCSLAERGLVGCSSGGSGTSTSALRVINDCGVVSESSRLGSDLATSGATCLTVAASGIEIDGAGHRISASQFAISWDPDVQPSNVTIHDVISSAGLQIFGENADGNVIERSTFGDVGIFRGDDNRIENSSMTRLVVNGQGANDVHHAVIRNNEIAGDNIRLVEVLTTGDASLPCGRGDHELTGNHIIGHAASAGAACDDSGSPCAGSSLGTAPSASCCTGCCNTVLPMLSGMCVPAAQCGAPAPSSQPPDQILLFLLCGNHMTISGNVIESDADHPAHGIHIRDEADENIFEDNQIRIPLAIAGIIIASGSPPRQHPRANTFHGNIVETGAGGPALWVQAHDATDNVFEQNLFQTTGDPSGWLDGVQNQVDHNTFYNGGVGPALRLDDLRSPGNTFTSNVFAHSGQNTVDFAGNQPVISAYQGDFNVFSNRAGSASFGGRSLAQWRSDTGQDADSSEADPQFCSASGGDFKLEFSSPAVGAGKDGTTAGAFPAGCP